MTSPADRVAKALQAKPQPVAHQAHHPVAFLLASTDLGPLILSRLDYRNVGANQAYGVGFELLETSTYAQPELDTLLKLLDLRRKHHGSPIVMIDGGANIGIHTVVAARHMRDWGSVIAIEAQERIFYALAGNVALNNLFNVRCLHAVISDKSGVLDIPQMNFKVPGSYGSFECKRTTRPDTGQSLDWEHSVEVQEITLDSLSLPRVDIVKLDVEGMELQGLDGCGAAVGLHGPIFIVEHIKSDRAALEHWFTARGYRTAQHGMNIVAIRGSDPCVEFLDLTPAG